MKIIIPKKLATSVILILLVLLLSGCLGDGQNNDNNGEYVENIEFMDLSGELRNTSEFQGKVVLIDLFGVRCPPCQQQMLVLKDIYEDYNSKNFEIISIDVWMQSESPSLIELFIEEYKNEMDIELDWLFGYDDEQGTIYNQYVESGVPTIIILDKNGNIYYRNEGYTEYSYLSNKIDEKI